MGVRAAKAPRLVGGRQPGPGVLTASGKGVRGGWVTCRSGSGGGGGMKVPVGQSDGEGSGLYRSGDVVQLARQVRQTSRASLRPLSVLPGANKQLTQALAAS